MRRVLPLAGVAVCALVAAALVAGALGTFRPGGAPERGWTPAQLEDELICPVCDRPLNQSHSDPADQIRDELSALHARGVTRSQVRTQLVRDYGTRVLADTPTSGAGLAAWLAPIAILLAGLALAVALARRWQTAGPPPPAGPLDDRYDRLVDDHLRALD